MKKSNIEVVEEIKFLEVIVQAKKKKMCLKDKRTK